MTYVDGRVVAARADGTTADAVGMVIVLVPAYIVLVRWIVVVLVVSTFPDLLRCQATFTI